ncbi:MAG TPA: DUF488 domain-containing protein [Candidatus Eisenbacteria bacterium]|nr:DUF488 domain-containing protein [Candidatus Eisenbacteria bacterium]
MNGQSSESASEPRCRGADKTIHTIGHSTRTVDAFLELLQSHGVERLIDVRRWPGSRRHPQFNRDALSSSLARARIEYAGRRDLGGFRKPADPSPNSGWRVGAFRAYADFMLTPEFGEIMEDMEKLARAKPSALMCAEALPWRCHRQLLADAYSVRGWTVRHIFEDGCQEHRLPAFARVEGNRIVYPGATTAKP